MKHHCKSHTSSHSPIPLSSLHHHEKSQNKSETSFAGMTTVMWQQDETGAKVHKQPLTLTFTIVQFRAVNLPQNHVSRLKLLFSFWINQQGFFFFFCKVPLEGSIYFPDKSKLGGGTFVEWCCSTEPFHVNSVMATAAEAHVEMSGELFLLFEHIVLFTMMFICNVCLVVFTVRDLRLIYV